MPDWDEDSDALFENLKNAYRRSRDEARQRVVPDVGLARRWHSMTMVGLAVPDNQFIGHFRGESGIEGYEVKIGSHPGVLSTLVAQELEKFEQTMQAAVSALDQRIPQGGTVENSDQLNAVIELCAWVHAEWVRIHPLANGNGRTARLWAGFIAMRYGLPPFVTLRPRPDGGYAAACDSAMEHDWAPTALVFRRMYLDLLL